VAAVRSEQSGPKEIQGPLGVVGPFHVQPDEAAKVPGLVEDKSHVAVAEVLADIEAHLGQFYGDVHFNTLRCHSVEHRQILIPGGPRVALYRDAFSQQVERRRDPVAAQVASHFDRFIDRLAGHKAGRELSRHPVSPDKIEDSLLF
jgi:hypothetical protein